MTSYSIDAMAALMLGLETNHFKDPFTNEFLSLMDTTFANPQMEYCGVVVPGW
jgi:hypothetical protein